MVGARTLPKCDSTARVLMMGQGLKVNVTNVHCHIVSHQLGLNHSVCGSDRHLYEDRPVKTGTGLHRAGASSQGPLGPWGMSHVSGRNASPLLWLPDQGPGQ